LNQLLFDTSISVSMETTPKIEKCKSQQPTYLEEICFLNEPESTYFYMHMIYFTCLFYVFFEIFKIS